MPKVTAEYRAARKAEIVAASWRLFSENGFHNTSMADVIAACGLSAGAVYRYFRSKEEIIGAVAEQALATTDETFARMLADGATISPAQAVTTTIDAIVERAAHDPETGADLTRVALQVWAEALRNDDLRTRAGEAFARIRANYAEVARRWQAAGHLPPDAAPDQVAAAMLGLTQGFLIQRQLVDNTTPATYTAGLKALLGP